MHSMIQLCCLVLLYLATVPIFPGIHIWVKSVKISCFQIFLCSSLCNPASVFLVLSFQIYRVWELKYIGSFLFWSLKVIFLPVLLNFKIYSPLNLTLPIPCTLCCLQFYKSWNLSLSTANWISISHLRNSWIEILFRNTSIVQSYIHWKEANTEGHTFNFSDFSFLFLFTLQLFHWGRNFCQLNSVDISKRDTDVYIEQSYGLCGRGRGWEDLGE